MSNAFRWRVLAVVAVVAGAGALVATRPVRLGLDLQGGTQIVLEAQDTDRQKVDEDTASRTLEVLRRRVDAWAWPSRPSSGPATGASSSSSRGWPTRRRRSRSSAGPPSWPSTRWKRFSLILATLSVSAGLDARLAPFVAGYVLVLAICGPLAATWSHPLSRFVPSRLLAQGAAR